MAQKIMYRDQKDLGYSKKGERELAVPNDTDVVEEALKLSRNIRGEVWAVRDEKSVGKFQGGMAVSEIEGLDVFHPAGTSLVQVHEYPAGGVQIFAVLIKDGEPAKGYHRWFDGPENGISEIPLEKLFAYLGGKAAVMQAVSDTLKDGRIRRYVTGQGSSGYYVG